MTIRFVVCPPGVELVPAQLPGWLLGLWASVRGASSVSWVTGALKQCLRFAALHSGLPVLLVAAVLIVVGFRVLKKSLRLAAEIAVVALALVAATELGWIQW